MYRDEQLLPSVMIYTDEGDEFVMALIPNKEPIFRAGLLGCYAANIAAYIKLQHPEQDEKEILAWVENRMQKWFRELKKRLAQARSAGEDLDVPRDREHMLWPTVRIVRSCPDEYHPKIHDYGNFTLFPDADLLEAINQYRDKIIGPFGSFYETKDKCDSFLVGMIGIQKKQRKKEKKLMAEAQRNGDKAAESFHKNLQTLIKINMNSIPGSKGSAYNFLSSKADYNSVTSISRYCIMNSYVHAERFLAANFYFRNEEQVENWIVNCKNAGPNPDDVVRISSKFNIYVPTVDDVYEFVCHNLHKYTPVADHPTIRKMIESLAIGERMFVFYMSNMKHLVDYNSDFFKAWTTKFFYRPETTADPTVINKLDAELVTVLATVHSEEIPLNEKGNPISIYDTVTAYPELASKLAACGLQMDSSLKEIQDLFDIYMQHDVGIGYISEAQQMLRWVVATSDTDSILFTTKEWVKWYLGELKMTHAAFDINALVVYWLSKANANILFYLSRILGSTGDDMFILNMKNEFMMPVEIVTTLKKHYMALLAVQEGVVYSTPRLDIKGVGLRGSNFSKGTLGYVSWFIRTLLDDIYTNVQISAKKYISYVMAFERVVYDSLQSGSTEFLTIDPIKNADEYKDADRTIYFNFLFWEEVFGEKYGNIAVPTKCYVLPLTSVKHSSYMDWLEQNSPDIAEKLKVFLEKNSKKNITRIPINPLTNEIPPELRQITNYKAVIWANTRPLYLIISSLGLTVGANPKLNVLFSDQYGWVTSEAAAEARKHC